MLDDVQKTLVWQEALTLSAAVVRVCEEFTQPDADVLVRNLRESLVAVPASLASDILNKRKATLEPLVKLGAELELVGKIYPAIDIEEARECLESIHQRIAASKFKELIPEPVAEAEEEEAGEPTEAAEAQ